MSIEALVCREIQIVKKPGQNYVEAKFAIPHWQDMCHTTKTQVLEMLDLPEEGVSHP